MKKSANNAKSTRAATDRKKAGHSYRGPVVVGKSKYFGSKRTKLMVQKVWVERPNQDGNFEYLKKSEEGQVYHCIVTSRKVGHKEPDYVLTESPLKDLECFSSEKWVRLRASVWLLEAGEHDEIPEIT